MFIRNFICAGTLATALIPFASTAGVHPSDSGRSGLVDTTDVFGESVESSAPSLARTDSGSTFITQRRDSSLQLYASDKAAELRFERSGSMLGLTNDKSRIALLFSEERDNAVTASFLYDTHFDGINGLTISFGSKLIAGLLALENTDVIGLGASLELAYRSSYRRFPVELSAELAYAPDILTFGQSDRIIDFNYRAGLPLATNISGFVGLRYLQFDTRPGERKLDQDIHVGFRWAK